MATGKSPSTDTTRPQMPGPLSGVRVLDLSSVIVGPACTVRLADYGAEVIKIETPEGDLMRTLGGPSPSGAHSGSYLHFNRGKRSVCLNLKKPEALTALFELVAKCDVLVTNMRPAALDRLGLTTDAIKKANPSIITCLISGFGPNGPYRGLPAYDSVLQGVSGIAGLFERRDGAPTYVPLLICDHVVGEVAAGAIMSGLLERERTGIVRDIEVPMFETMAAFVLQEHLGPYSFTPTIGVVGDSRILSPFNGPLQTSDGWLGLTTNTDAQVHSFLKVVGREDLIDDPRFETSAARFRNADDWFEFRRSSLRGNTTAYWLDEFSAADIPAMPCHSLNTVVHDPHLKAVNLIGEVAHPTEGMTKAIRSTILRDGSLPAAASVAVPVGWDTYEVLVEAGLSAALVDDMIEKHAAFDSRELSGEARKVARGS